MKVAIFILVSQICCSILYIKKTWHILAKILFRLAGLEKTFPVSRPCNWTLMIFLIRSVMIFVNTAFEISRLTKKKAGISVVTIVSRELFVQRFK